MNQEGVSGRSIMAALRQAGVQFRDTTFWGIRREALGLKKWEEQIRTLRPDTLVPKKWMVVPSKALISQQAQYRFSATAVDLTTGEETQIFRALATNAHLTGPQATEQISDLHLEPSKTSNYKIENIQLYQVWVKEGKKLQ